MRVPGVFARARVPFDAVVSECLYDAPINTPIFIAVCSPNGGRTLYVSSRQLARPTCAPYTRRIIISNDNNTATVAPRMCLDRSTVYCLLCPEYGDRITSTAYTTGYRVGWDRRRRSFSPLRTGRRPSISSQYRSAYLVRLYVPFRTFSGFLGGRSSTCLFNVLFPRYAHAHAYTHAVISDKCSTTIGYVRTRVPVNV